MVYVPQPNAGFSKGANYQKKPRWDEHVNWYSLPGDAQYHTHRFFGDVYMVAWHWITTKSGKKFSFPCLNYERGVGQKLDHGNCPVEHDFNYSGEKHEFPNEDVWRKISKLKPSQQGLTHSIVREIQARGSDGSPEWRPWRPVRLPMSVVIGAKKIRGLNTHNINGEEMAVDITDPYYGMDVQIMYNPAAKIQERYSVAHKIHTALTEEEMGYTQELHDWGRLVTPLPPEEIKESLMRAGYYQLINSNYVQGADLNGSASMFDQTLPQVPMPNEVTINPAPAPAPVPQPAPQPVAQAPQPVPQPVAQAPQPAPQPVAQAPQPAPVAQQPNPVPNPAPNPALQQPVSAAQQSAQPAPVTPTPPAPSGERQFALLGKKETVGEAEFQQIINEYGQNISRAHPMAVATKDAVEGLSVYACIGNFEGDDYCIKCPLRRHCLMY